MNEPDYYTEAQKASADAEEDLGRRSYGKAVEKFKLAGGNYLRLAKNSPPDTQVELLSRAIKEYESAQVVLNNQQSQARTPGGIQADIPELVKQSSDLGKIIKNISSAKDLLTKKHGSLGKKLLGSFSIIALAGALASISMNLTGNVIGGSSDNNNFISIGLFFLGCLLTLFYFKAKNSRIKIPHSPARKKKKK